MARVAVPSTLYVRLPIREIDRSSRVSSSAARWIPIEDTAGECECCLATRAPYFDYKVYSISNLTITRYIFYISTFITTYTYFAIERWTNIVARESKKDSSSCLDRDRVTLIASRSDFYDLFSNLF